MIPTRNLPLLMNLAYVAYNRGLAENSPHDFMPIKDKNGEIIVTFCNQAIQYVANSLGYGEFNGMMANDMDAFMRNPSNGWIEVSDEVAQTHASNGVLVIASKAETPHGHVALVLPGILEYSYSYGRRVPKVLNIGGDVFIGKKLSYAFRANRQPSLFALGGMI